jgi:hypothetical protein
MVDSHPANFQNDQLCPPREVAIENRAPSHPGLTGAEVRQVAALNFPGGTFALGPALATI